MTRTRLTFLTSVAALALAATACSTSGPNQGILDAQARLSGAYAEKLTAERGQGDLASAKAALAAAQVDWTKGEKETTQHEVVMASTFIDLAEVRGQQAFVEEDTVRLKNLAELAAKNRTIAGKNQELALMDQALVAQGERIAAKDQELADAKLQLKIYDMKVTEIGATMVLDDVSFETGKSDLLSGGVNRLQTLINYLRLSPTTRVRIEGFTDNVGGSDYNRQLSLARAQSVKQTLTNASIDPSRIEAIGSGYDNPVSTNATESGRQSNRRVEITLLRLPGV
jgi:outer membrane protein OmpA-like peptidoglycan-associated protein